MGRMAELHYELSLMDDQLPDYDMEDEKKDDLLIQQHDFQDLCLSDEINRLRKTLGCDNRQENI